MPVFCVGLSHHSAPVELLEALSRSAEELPRFLPSRPAEVVVLSTCNRFEVFGSRPVTYSNQPWIFFAVQAFPTPSTP